MQHQGLRDPLTAHTDSRWFVAAIWATRNKKTLKKNDLWRLLPHHVNSFVDDNILDFVHLNEGGGFSAGGVAGGHLYPQGADDQQGLVVDFHKVDVKRHADQGDEDGTGQDSCVLQNREHAHKETSL